MIKFPTTISEYTDGRLWKDGVDESIARRILVDLHKIEDKKELDLRKMYLAHFYYEIGEYRVAMTLAKGFLLENKYVDDALILIKDICISSRDYETFAQLIKLIDTLYHGNPPASFFDDIDEEDIDLEFFEDHATKNGQIIYTSGMAEYYQKGKLIFSVEDKSYEAFVKDSGAKFLLTENEPQSAIEILQSIKMEKLKPSMKRLCFRTYARAYCMMRQYDKAYDYCIYLLQNGIYITEMADVLIYLYGEGLLTQVDKFNKLKELMLAYKGYDVIQLGDMHSIAKEIDDEDFWMTIFKNNPIDPANRNEEVYILKGILAFNSQDYKGAGKLFKQAKSLYGRFGKVGFFIYYLDSYLKKLKKDPYANGMPFELFTARIDDVYDFIDKKLLSKLKKVQSVDDFKKNLDDNLLEIDNMLSGVYTKAKDVAKVVNNIYRLNYLPAQEIIKRVAVDNEFSAFIRAICLANYLLYSGQKKFMIGRNIYVNPFTQSLNFDREESKQPLEYGIAIYLALSMIEGTENSDLAGDCNVIKKIYSSAMGDFSDVSPLAIFGVLLSYFSEEKVHYDKEVVKKRDVKAFAQAFVDGADLFGKNEELFQDDDVFDFLRYCLDII